MRFNPLPFEFLQIFDLDVAQVAVDVDDDGDCDGRFGGADADGACVGTYDAETIMKWLKKFYWRFFSQQFKRSAMPDGPKVGSVTLSPRGDWRMPSDASAAAWLRELDML